MRDARGQTDVIRRIHQRFVSKPYYVFRPSQLLRRVAGRTTGKAIGDGLELGELPWGLPLAYEPSESMGSGISRTGVFDLLVTEALFRLVESGELALDVGANIGYMTSVLAKRLGPSGSVVAIEPHPLLASQLQQNVERWAEESTATVQVVEAAASASDGAGVLEEGPEFGHNRGTAELSSGAVGTVGSSHSVRLVRIDDYIDPQGIGVLKLDVEGHEQSALEGAARALEDGRIRDVVFEDLVGYPTAVTNMLESAGYQIFLLDHRLRGPSLLPPTTSNAGNLWTVDSYLATLAPDRARQRMRPLGWRSLRSAS
jgi:FkbM family methyltransferase